MIKPHGSNSLNPLYVADDAKRAELEKEAEGLPKLLVCSQAAANAVMMGCGYFNPLTGFMNLADALSVSEKLQTASGLFWPVPVLNLTSDASGIKGASRIALLMIVHLFIGWRRLRDPRRGRRKVRRSRAAPSAISCFLACALSTEGPGSTTGHSGRPWTVARSTSLDGTQPRRGDSCCVACPEPPFVARGLA